MKKQAINERIHRGFRAWLLELGIRVEKTDFAGTDEGRKTAAKLQELISAWERKFILESELFFPALALKAPYAVALLDEEKRIVESKCRQLSRIIQQYLQPGLPQHYVSTGRALLEAFSSLSDLLFRYMKHQDRLFHTAADSAEGADWIWSDVDKVLLWDVENQLHMGLYPTQEDFFDVVDPGSGIPESRVVQLGIGGATGQLAFAEKTYRKAVPGS